MDDSEWAQVAERFAASMGLDECAWVAVRHDDPEADGREHVHLLSVAVTDRGERWDDSLDRPGRSRPAGRSKRSVGWWSLTRRSAAAMATRRLRRPRVTRRGVAVRSLISSRHEAHWSARLIVATARGGVARPAEREGVRLDLRERDGAVKGVSVTVERSDGEGERTFKASALHRSLSAAGISGGYRALAGDRA